MGGAVDFVGDIVGGAADVVGDVAGGVADFAGDVVQDFGPEIATAIAIYYLGPAALAEEGALAAGAETFGSSTAADILANEAASAAFNSGLGSIGSSLVPGSVPGGGYQGGFIKTGIDSLDTALNLAKSGYDLYGLYNQTQQRPTQQIPALTYQQTSSGEQVDPNAFGKGLQYSFIAGLPELGDITEIITKSVSGLGNILMNAFGTDNLSEVIKKYGPSVLSVIGGKLSYDAQKRINDIVMDVYNKYNVGTELKKLQYRTGEGLASLPIFRSQKQLGSQTTAQAPQRTAADVVYRPKAQMGGIMSNEQQPIFPRLETLSQNLGQAEQTLGQPSNQFNTSSITTAVTGQQPQRFADGGYTDDEMETKKEFYYGRRRNEMEDLLDEYERFKMRKDYQKKYPRDEARNGGRIGYAIGGNITGKPGGISDEDLKNNYTLISPPGTFNPIYEKNVNLPSMPAKVRPIGLFQNPDGSYPGDNMPNPIQALSRPGIPNQAQGQLKTQGISKSLVANAMKDPRFLKILNSVKNKELSNVIGRPNRPGYKFGSMPVRTNQAGISELDYRQKGGYVPPIGVKEKADDIPAMLSNNEFVFTANAVRGAGGGSVKEGAKKMYSLMKQLEGRS